MCFRLQGRPRGLASDERGATSVEYGIMAALIAAVIFGTVKVFGVGVQVAFQSVMSGLE